MEDALTCKRTIPPTKQTFSLLVSTQYGVQRKPLLNQRRGSYGLEQYEAAPLVCITARFLMVFYSFTSRSPPPPAHLLPPCTSSLPSASHVPPLTDCSCTAQTFTPRTQQGTKTQTLTHTNTRTHTQRQKNTDAVWLLPSTNLHTPTPKMNLHSIQFSHNFIATSDIKSTKLTWSNWKENTLK